METLDQAVAIVTGASSGIGSAVARQLAAAGARVVLAARREDRLDALRAAIVAAGGIALGVPTDVTDRGSVQATVDRAHETFGPVDFLVNNAGVMPLSPIRDRRIDDWDWMIDVNIRGVLYAIAAVLPDMLDRKRGHIINVSSVAGRRPLPAGVIYSATKFAVRAISDGLRLELSAGDGIRVTDIEPGVVATELQDHIPDPATRQRFQDHWEGRTPLAADDVARAVVYAASQPPHVNVNEILIRPTDQPT